MSQDTNLRLPGAVEIRPKPGAAKRTNDVVHEPALSEVVTVRIKLSQQQLAQWFTGRVNNVVAKSVDHRQVTFPVQVLRPFMGKYGVEGTFEIEYSVEGKFLGIKQVW